MNNRNPDTGFEKYRRERQRRRLQSGETFRPLVENHDALRELEMAEAREVQDRRLTREVHEFFAEATKTAASIVQKVSDEHEEKAKGKLAQEMEEFLMDAFRRMHAFVNLIKQRSAPGGPVEQILEAEMHRLVGPVLDAFRKEGTAELDDKHIGQDPFATEVGESRRPGGDGRADTEATGGDPEEADDEIRVRPAAGPSLSGPIEDIEHHLVAELHRDEEEEAEEEEPAREHAQAQDVEQAEEPEPPAVRPQAGQDLERLKVALRTLVRQGLMTKDEARAKYREALADGGVTSG